MVFQASFVHIVQAKLGQADAGDNEAKLMTKLAPEWVRSSDPVIRSPARYRWTTAPAPHNVRGGLLIDLTIVAIALLSIQFHSSSLTSHNGMSVQQFQNSFNFRTVDKVASVRVMISVKFNYMYFMTSLRGKNEVEVKFENSMHNYNAARVH